MVGKAKLDCRRGELAGILLGKGLKVGAEIGVDRGLFSEELCRNYPQIKLYCIDPWKAYPEYGDITSQETLDANYKETCLRVPACIILRKTSMEALGDFADGSLDFVYIDGNHSYEFVKQDLEGWTKKVKKGGIISGHDYRDPKHTEVGVSRAVDEYLEVHNIQTLFLMNKNHDSSWFFIND